MARFEGNFTAAAATSLSPAELHALAQEQAAGDPQRQQAIARVLSGEAGWRDAIEALGGSFATGAAEERLSGGNPE